MGTSLLCETVTGRTMAELLTARDNATAADMVELRLDGVSDVDVARALNGRRCAVVATCRPAWEGGRFDGSDEDRLALIEQALDAGAEFVDIEWRALRLETGPRWRALVERHGPRIVLSSHDF